MLTQWRSTYLAILLVAVLSVLLSPEPLTAQTPSRSFYYYRGARVPLTLDSTHVAVRFDSSATPATRQSVVRSTDDLGSLDQAIDTGVEGVSIVPVRPGRDPQSTVARLKSHPEVQAAGRVFRFPDGALYAETDEFIVRGKSGQPQSQLDDLNRRYGVEAASPQAYSRGALVLHGRAGDPRGALDLANAYVESGLVAFAEPNFVIVQPQPTELSAAQPKTATVPNDPHFQDQWALQNTGQCFDFPAACGKPGDDINAPAAWGVITGTPTVIIAVLDEGVASNHPDLVGKVLVGQNFDVDPPNTNTQPSTPNEMHGTAAASLAAARTNNAIGISGVCWRCKILPVKIAHEENHSWVTSVDRLYNGIEWAWNNGAADVLSNSWTMSAPSDVVEAAIIDARYSGRDGMGSTLVFASGNENASTVDFPASLDSYVIAVGASNWCDQRKTKGGGACNFKDTSWGSNYGRSLDLVAPGGWVYSACTGTLCTDGDYTLFSGTSASTPIAAGVVGLLYSLNPDLMPNQVQSALQRGARDLPPVGRDDGTGYGRIDAYRAIQALYDLTLTVKDSGNLPRPGDTIQYTLAYTNTGLTAMPSSMLSITLPSGLDLVSALPPLDYQGGYYSLDPGTLPRYAIGSVALTTRAQVSLEGQAITLQAHIGGAFPELNTSNNTVADTITVAKYTRYLPMLLR